MDYYLNHDYDMAMDLCTTVVTTPRFQHCTSVIEGLLLCKIEAFIDIPVGLVLLYEYVIWSALNNRSDVTPFVNFFTLLSFAHYLSITAYISNGPTDESELSPKLLQYI
jgi:hypothetical protein